VSDSGKRSLYYNVELIRAVKVLLCRSLGYLIQVGSNYSYALYNKTRFSKQGKQGEREREREKSG
jgi:hypothetical protein